jgi:hypothetical protein
MTQTRLIRVEAGGAVVAGSDGIEQMLEAEKVILAAGNRPLNTLYEKVKSLGYETYQIGDCLETRSAKAAIFDSAVLGRSI